MESEVKELTNLAKELQTDISEKESHLNHFAEEE